MDIEVRSSGGADGVELPFAAVPVTIDATPDLTEYCGLAMFGGR